LLASAVLLEVTAEVLSSDLVCVKVSKAAEETAEVSVEEG
jgi:hypothetical protein